MSAKWRALQHRHKYTYNAVVFPKSYTDSLLLALQNTTSSSSKFYQELKQLISLNSIYAQINHAKKVASSFSDFLSNTNTKHETSPIVMEQCQEALSCLYYLFQRFPLKFTDAENVLEASLTVILSVHNSVAFSRDCYVAAGMSFCTALQVFLNPQELALFIIEGIFHRTTINDCENELRNVIAKVPYKGDVCNEILNFSALSRLCLIRGVLTAVSRNVLNSRFDISRDSGGNSVVTILYDGILPELCDYCENPTDSHFNFHALTVMQICLQQIKTSMLANISNPSGDYELIPEEMGARIMRLIWNNLEDPLSQTVKQVHLIFDLFLDIQSSLCWSEGGERIKSFLEKIALHLLRLGPRCKGRYVPLASLIRRLGAKTMLDMKTDLLYETIHAYVDDDVCCAVTSFLKCYIISDIF